ncbi:MAG: DinB family protein [Dehalococcoidia bacterium]
MAPFPDDRTPIAVRLLLDAMSEFGRHIENVPPPGRGGAIGRLSPASWTAAHGASKLDHWINAYATGDERDPWCAAFDAEPSSRPVGFTEAQATYERVRERAARALEGIDRAALARVAPARRGSFLEGQRVGDLLLRAVAHLFAHCGELSVASSLLRRADLGLPGPMSNAYGAPLDGDAAGGPAPLLVRFVLDAREAFATVAASVPVPAQRGAFDRVNAGGWIVAHIAEQEDQYWSVHAQGLEADPWLASARVRFGDPASAPAYGEALDALRAATERGTPYLEGLTAEHLGDVLRTSRMPGRGAQRAQDLLVLQAPHLYALAGELAAIGSLAGGEDPELPMTMRHTILPLVERTA